MDHESLATIPLQQSLIELIVHYLNIIVSSEVLVSLRSELWDIRDSILGPQICTLFVKTLYPLYWCAASSKLCHHVFAN